MSVAIKLRNRQRGEGNLKAVMFLVVLGVIGYLLVKIVPHYVNDYQLHDTMVSEARFFAARQIKPDAVREVVWKEIMDLRIPAKREDILVSEMGHTAHVEVKYTIAVELPGYTLNLNFNPTAESPIL